MLNVAVIDYGGSNLRSVAKALEVAADKRARITITDDTALINRADRVVFPGQGAIGNCMAQLRQKNLIEAIGNAVKNRPFLGICLGLQSLMTSSDEDNGTTCLGIYPGTVRRFSANPPPAADGTPQKIPHMGWNQVHWSRPHALTTGIAPGTRFYFVHSYFVQPQDDTVSIGKTDYIETFTAAIARQNVFATQFHPEKSAAAGQQILANFIAWNGES